MLSAVKFRSAGKRRRVHRVRSDFFDQSVLNAAEDRSNEVCSPTELPATGSKDQASRADIAGDDAGSINTGEVARCACASERRGSSSGAAISAGDGIRSALSITTQSTTEREDSHGLDS